MPKKSEQLAKLQAKILQYTGLIAVIMAGVYWVVILYNVIRSGWTFHEEGVGDLIMLCLLTVGFMLIYSIFSAAYRHEINWLYVPLIVLTVIYLVTPIFYIRVLEKGNDMRWKHIQKAFTRERQSSSS